MAARDENLRRKQKPHQNHSTDRSQGKVGSDPEADREFGGKLDFGVPAYKAEPPEGGREKGPDQGTGPMRSGLDGVRTSGVGHAPGPDGTGSEGDLDADFIGLDGKGGVAANPTSDDINGPDSTAQGGSAPFASGPPAHGQNQRHGPHGGPPEIVHGSTVDRSGGDASTTGPETGDSTGTADRP